MIQRFLFSALKQGVEAITADLVLLEHIFENYELAENEVESIKTLWSAKPPTVRHGFARPDDEFPLFALVLVDEHESETVMGDDGGIVEDPEDPLFGADIKTSFWEHNYNIMVYSDHPDATLYWYEVAKSIMLEAGFYDFGIYDLMLSGGDILPDPEYIPSHLFVRRLSLKASREFKRIVHTSRLGKAFKVSGIHIDRSGSPSDPGPVKTLLVPYAEGEDG
jgi:hypothetical protein